MGCHLRLEIGDLLLGGRRDRDNVPGALFAHDWQDGAGDIHRADEERPQLPLDLLRRQLLEVAGKEVAGIVSLGRWPRPRGRPPGRPWRKTFVVLRGPLTITPREE